MKLPTMEELRAEYKEPALKGFDFDIEVALYHGWMAALDGLNYKRDDEDYAEVIERLRDLANANMAATIGEGAGIPDLAGAIMRQLAGGPVRAPAEDQSSQQ